MLKHWKLTFLAPTAAAGCLLSYRFFAGTHVYGTAATITLLILGTATCAGWAFPRVTAFAQFLFGIVCVSLWNTPLEVLSFVLLIPFFRLIYCRAAASAALSALCILILAGWPNASTQLAFSPTSVALASTQVRVALALGLVVRKHFAERAQLDINQQAQQEDLVELLHNSVAADLTSVVINLEALAIETNKGLTQQTNGTLGVQVFPAGATERIEESAEKIRQSLSNIRMLINSLSKHGTSAPDIPTFDTIITRGTAALKNAGLEVNAHIAVTRIPNLSQ